MWEGMEGFNDTSKGWWMSKREAAQKNKMQERLEILAHIFWHLWRQVMRTPLKEMAGVNNGL